MHGQDRQTGNPRSAFGPRWRGLLRPMLVLAFWLGVWALLSWRVGLTLLLPGPLEVLRALAALARTGLFWRKVGLSLLRVFGGFAFGTLAGMLLAVLTSAVPLARALLAPAIRVVRATPVASFILLAVLWLNSGVLPGFIAGLMALPVVWNSMTEGIAATDRQLLELAKSYRFGPGKTLRLIYVPSLSPYLRAAMATSLGLAWKSGVAAEVLCSPRLAIGRSLADAKTYLQTPDLFAWTVTVILLSLVMEWLLARVLRHLPGGEDE